jgi:PAS domain S-box-containing protein
MKLRLLRNLSLRWKMIVGGVAAVTVPCLVIGGALYGMLSRSLQEIYREKAVQVARDLAALVDTTLRQEQYSVSTLALDPVIVESLDSGDYAAASRKLVAIHAGLPSPNYTYLLADKRGVVRADAVFQDSIGLDLHDREYFIKAREGNASFFGPVRARVPQTSNRASEIVVFACAPVKGKAGFSGILAAVIRINHFMEVVSSIRIGKTGYAFLVDANGLVIVHPDEKLILTTRLSDQPGMMDMYGRLLRGDTGSEGYVFGGTEKIAGFAPISIAGWHAVVTENKSEILAPINGILVTCLLIGLALFTLGFVFVITMSRRISTPVERMLDMLQRITAQSEDAILSIGRDRKISFANPAAEKAMAAGPGGIIGREPILSNLEDTPTEEIWKTLEEGKTWRGLVRFTRDGSETLTLTAIILPVRDHGGAVHSYLEIAKDITNELGLEARLRQSQKMEALGSMAGGIAHDFNNILSGIFGFSELSLSVEGNPAQTGEYLNEIMRAAERARDLTRQILMFSRQTTLEVKAVSLKHLVTEALKLIRASTPPTVDIRSALESDSIVMAGPTQIDQVIVNLCTNAVSALENGTGSIEVGLEDRDIDEGFARLHPDLHPGKHVLLRVSDSGRGIDPAILDRIFEPFFTTKPQGEGTGLGLSVVHGIVSRLNGAISVRSEPGTGTTFEILIPAAHVAESEVSREESAHVGGSERILLVDDELPIVRTVSTSLGSLGYAVSGFTDSTEALRAFAEDPGGFDILVTDNLMPRMDGFTMARRMRERRRDIPIVLCSGYLGPETEEKARAIGIQELLAKPVSVHQLTAAVRRALAARASP